MAKEKTINNKSIGSIYVNGGFYNMERNIDFPQLQQLSHFDLWYTALNKIWMTTLINSAKIGSTDMIMNKNKAKDNHLFLSNYIKLFGFAMGMSEDNNATIKLSNTTEF
ncbi:hypothetical protein BJ944DRAFT_239703 [Cunninghamella echinulata]|nr:hypothetical protein BJ944DRAFT_239703 [Cunninghamella echinulata]